MSSAEENRIKVVNVRLAEAPSLYSTEKVKTSEDAVRVIAGELKQYDREVFAIVNIKSTEQVINLHICSMGTMDATPISPREVMKAAILSNAAAFIGIHNHPSGNGLPSDEDILITKRLMKCGEILGIRMLDHIIVAGETGSTFSMFSAGMMNDKSLDEFMKTGEIKEPAAGYGRCGNQLWQDKDSFSIYQLRQGEDTRKFRFEAYDYLAAKGYAADMADYEFVYTAELLPGTSLEDIYTRFNVNHPQDFKGHSLSVSDVVVLHQNGQDTAYYVDSIGFKELPEFLRNEKSMPDEEMEL